MFPLWILLELRVMKVVVTTAAVRRARLQSNHHHQQTNTQFFYRLDTLPVVRPTVSEHWRKAQGHQQWHRSMPHIQLPDYSSTSLELSSRGWWRGCFTALRFWRPPLRSLAVRSHSLMTVSTSALLQVLVRRFSRTASVYATRDYSKSENIYL